MICAFASVISDISLPMIGNIAGIAREPVCARQASVDAFGTSIVGAVVISVHADACLLARINLHEKGSIASEASISLVTAAI